MSSRAETHQLNAMMNPTNHTETATRTRVVMFDIYGTLATWSPDRGAIQARAVASLGVNLTREGIEAGYAVAEAYMTHQNVDYPVRLMSAAEREHFFAEFEQKVLDGAGFHVDIELARRIWRMVSQQQYDLALYDDVVSHLDLFRERGLTVGIVSNMAIDGAVLASNLRLTPHIDFAVTSNEVGCEKPDPRIFEEALRRSGASDPKSAVMVGDQPESDLVGASNAGIDAILLDRYGRFATGQAPNAQRAENMKDVCEIILGTRP